jgi:hypothetical protein
MKLNVGERLEGAGPAHQPGGYVITGIVRETPWHALYAGKKIFYNFDFTAKRVRETDEVEWLDVFIRTIRYPILDDPNYVQQRRTLTRAEVRAILGNRHSNLWPEPLDLLEVENARDPFLFSAENLRTHEPVVVYARPQGRFTLDWQQQILPISSILSVLAELLGFMKQAHAEGLLLLGLGPSALMIDASDRVHYIGTELVLSQNSALLKDATPAALWTRLFPAERFPRGYTAPECFDSAKRPDARSDLYAWGMLAYSLLMGADLGAMAVEQNRPWIELADKDWSEMEKLLAQLPPSSVAGWAEQIGVDARALLDGWPTKLITVLQMLLGRDPHRRPRSVADLLMWLGDPPPPPIAGLIALHTGADSARLLLDCSGLEPGLEMSVQCARHTAAQLPTEGTTVAEGPLRPLVGLTSLPLTTDPIYYTVFTRRDIAGRRTYSPGVAAELWQPTESNLRHWAETQAAAELDGQPMPPPVNMALGVLDVDLVTESLAGSTLPRVRGWGLRRVEQVLQSQRFTDAIEAVLWRYLSDANVELRQTAATLLWSHHPARTDALLVMLIEALESPPIDVPVPIVHFLRNLRLSEERIHNVLAQIEARRPTECPLCKAVLPLGDRGAHLQAVHGYLSYQGDVLPASAVLQRLWERVFAHHDLPAHEELVGMYLNLQDPSHNADAAIERYLADLANFLIGEMLGRKNGNGSAPVALPYASILAFQMNVRASRSFLSITRGLLRSSNRRLAELGTQIVLPYLQEQLRIRSNVVDLRQMLGQVCAEFDQTDLQINLCRQLGQLGVDQATVGACIAQLQDERLVVCSECGAQVHARDLELHLRRAHQVFQFRGGRKPYIETRESILAAVCAPPPDLAAWRSLTTLAEDKHPGEVERYLVVWLYQYLRSLPAEQLGPSIAAVAEVVVNSGAHSSLMPHFTGASKNASWELLGQNVALEICTRLTGRMPPALVHSVIPFLDHRDLPRRARENATLALLRGIGKDDALAIDVLHAFVAQTSKKRAVEKLQQLEQRFGHSSVLDAAMKEVDDEIRVSCPRCPTELRKKEMVAHLWDRHRLYLDGQRAREPWRVIEDWVVDYGLEKDPQVFQNCRELALRDDPYHGLTRLNRLLFRRGLRDRELLSELRTQARDQNATLCPHCSAAVPIAEQPTIKPLHFESARLEGYGYLLEVSDRGLFPSLRIESPDTILYQGREPGRSVTRLGALLFAVLLAAAATFVGLELHFAEDEVLPGLIWAMAGGAGLLAAGFIYLIWPNPRPAKERIVKAAWQILVPEIFQQEMSHEEWGFLHGLVEFTEHVRRRNLNQDLLLDCCEEASKAARTDPMAHAFLTRLSKRCLTDMAERGEDPFFFVLTLVGECFKGKLPLSFLGDLLENFHGRERALWSNGDLNRLPILVAHHAFSAEAEIDDWLNLGRAFPALASVLSLEQRWHWLQFFTVWSKRNQAPWESAGAAHTMIDLAKAANEYEEILAHYPDVLLYAPKANIVIGSKGVWIEGVCVTSFLPGTEVSLQKISGHHELTIGAIKIRCSENPRAYLDDIECWLRFYFQEFVPTVANVARPLLESRHRMWQSSKLLCPECGRALAPCVGDLGIALR